LIKGNLLLMEHSSGNQHHSDSINKPLPSITTIDHNSLITAKAQFISKQYNSNGNPEANNQSIEDPCGSLTSQEKIQFITAYFNSSGNPGTQNQSLDSPLGTILTGSNKKALITAIENGEFDFDIKMRFLEPEELSQITTFPERYFTNPQLRLSKKDQVKLIGNAVPPQWARMIIEPVVKELDEILSRKRQAI
jgi:DNA (cytosine-5)-methyltransferase 1